MPAIIIVISEVMRPLVKQNSSGIAVVAGIITMYSAQGRDVALSPLSLSEAPRPAWDQTTDELSFF